MDKNKIILRVSWVSTIGNAFLSLAKLIIGFFTGSLAVLSDGIDSATDVLISIVMVFTSRIMNRPPDRQYVFGYEKAESIATKILSFVVFYAGIHMLTTSIKSIINIYNGEVRELPGTWAIYVTVFSIAGKLLLSLYQFKIGKRIDSQMLTANAKNMRNDVLISISVLVGLFFTFIMQLPVLDVVTSLVVSIFILRTAVMIFMDSNVELMDGVKDVSVYDRIFAAVLEVSGASRPHRVRSRTVGGMYVISLDIEADGNISLNDAHRIAHAVEDKIREKVENVYDIRIHVEPKGTIHDCEKFGVE